MLGLSDKQISQLVLHYYHSDHSRAEKFLQYLSSVPNFSNLKRVPVYLSGLLSVFDITSTAHPPQTLMAFLSCLALIMLNLPQDELQQVIQQLATKSIPEMFLTLPSPAWSLLQTVRGMLFPRSKPLFTKKELITWPNTPSSLLRPVQFALPLRSGEWLQLTQYSLLNDFLASLHLYNQNLPVVDTIRYLTDHKTLQYFCLKMIPNLHEDLEKQTKLNYALTLTQYVYEDGGGLDCTMTTTELHNTALTAQTMYFLTSAVKEIVFTACDFSPAAAVILSNSIGNGNHVKYHESEITYARSDSSIVQSKSVDGAIHPLFCTYTLFKYVTLSTRFDWSSWLYYMMNMRSFDFDIGAIDVYLGDGSQEECTDILTPLYELKFTVMRIYSEQGDQPVCDVCKDCESTYKVFLHESDVEQCMLAIHPLYQLEGSRVRVQRSSTDGEWVVHEINLNHAGLGDPGARALGDVLLHLAQLQRLYLNNNELSDEGVQHLSEALKICTTLREVYLYGNSIHDEGVKCLMPSIKTCTSLYYLDLADNALTDGCVQDITELIMSLKSLTQLWLYGNQFTEHGERSLHEAEEKRSKLANYSKLNLYV